MRHRHASGAWIRFANALIAAITARVVCFSVGLMKVSTSGERFLVETALFGASTQRCARQASLPMFAEALLCLSAIRSWWWPNLPKLWRHFETIQF